MKNNRSLKKPIPERVELDKDRIRFFLFIEGDKREEQYFGQLQKFSSRLELKIFPPQTKSAPWQLYEKAEAFISNPNNDYDNENDGDEIWLIFDTDLDVLNANPKVAETKKETLIEVRKGCRIKKWNVAQSNPCFEVWLYYHQSKAKPIFTSPQHIEVPEDWKNFLPTIFSGGFNSEKHFFEISDAINNAKAVFKQDADGMPEPATTEVFLLAEKIYPFIKERMEEYAKQLAKFEQDRKNNP